MAQNKLYKVAVLGAAGGIGQPLSLLLASNPKISELRLYDIVNTPGVAADLSHIDGSAQITGYMKDEQLKDAIEGADLVVIPAGVPRKPGMTRDDLFNINASIVKNLVASTAQYSPKAWILIISNPVNSTVPIAAKVLQKYGVYDPKKLFGVTTLDVVRANKFMAQKFGVNARDVSVPVIGGHAGITILPLLSQSEPSQLRKLDESDVKALTDRIQNAGTEVVNAKAGAGSATLSMAYAGSNFVDSCLRALGGEENIVQCTYVQSEVTELPFFASKVLLGKDGISKYQPLGQLSDYEQKSLNDLKAELNSSIEKGENFPVD